MAEGGVTGGQEPQWWHLDHRCPICGAFWPASNYAHGYYADHMILAHGIYGPPCDEDCVGCITLEEAPSR